MHHQAAGLNLAAIGQILDPQARLAAGNVPFFIEQIAERPTDHHAHQLRRVELVAHQAADILPIAQDADPVGELIHFRHAVADIDDRHPLIAQAQDELEQALGFPRGEGGGGFIHHQNAALTVQGAGDLHLLLLGDGQGHHPVAGPELGAETVDHRLRLAEHGFALHQTTARQLAAEENVFRDGQVRRQLHLLVDQRDPGGQRVLGAADRLRFSVDQDLAAGGGIGAGEDLHQRAFSGAVLPHQGMDLAGPDRQVDALQRVEFAKSFGDMAHFQYRGGGHRGAPVCKNNSCSPPPENKCRMSESIHICHSDK